MHTLKRLFASGLLLLVLPSLAHAQFGNVSVRVVNIDYYLLNYFNRVADLPRSVGGDYVNHYPAINFFSPSFYFVSHDLDFLSAAQSVRTMSLGGSGVAVQGGASALAVNPAGIVSGESANEIYFGITSRFGSGQSSLSDELLFDTGIVGNIVPLDASLDPRFMFNQGGLYLAARPFLTSNGEGTLEEIVGRLAFAAGYRRFVEMSNPTNSITNFLPEGGLQGLSAELKSAAQSREKGGVDAVSLGFATGIGDEDSPVELTVGGTANIVSGRIQADQVFTVSQLTQIVVELPGGTGRDAYVKQKFTGTAFDLGAQLGLAGGALRVGGTFRPSYTLEMRNGKYSAVEAGFSTGSPQDIAVVMGSIADYDMELPASLRVGGALRLTPLLGDGVDRRGILGYVHRFFGRAEVSADFAQQNLSEATVQHVDEMLDNSALGEDPAFQLLNLNLAEAFGPGAVIDPVMPLANGDAMLRDKSSIHVGMETPIFDRPELQLDLRLGFETVPLSFPSLVTDGGSDVRRNADGTPVVEDVEGTGISVGLGYTSGGVRFDVGFRRVAYDFVQWWGGAEPQSWYNPVTGLYEPLASEEQYAALKVSQTSNTFQFAATLGF